MPDDLERRIERALRADVADLPMTITPSMVDERLEHSAGPALRLPLMVATIAASFVLAVAVAAGIGRDSGAAPQLTIVRSDQAVAPVEASAPAVCLVVQRTESGEVSAWWYSPGAARDCATTSSTLTAIVESVTPSEEDDDAYALEFLVQVTTGDLEFVKIAATARFPAAGMPHFSTPHGQVSATPLDRVHVPMAISSLNSPIPTPVQAPSQPPDGADPSDCPATMPVRAPEEIGDQLFGWGSGYGTDDLWVGGLGPNGVIITHQASVDDDGTIGWKLGWWRSVRGTLEISGRRIDGDAPPLEAGVPDGYGSIGFQASGVGFPTEGCWEITGRVGDAELTFVTLVLDVEAEVERLFEDSRTCRTALGDVDLDVTFPASWSASEPTGALPGCNSFGPESIDVEGRAGSPPDGVAITLGAVGGPEGPVLPGETVVARRNVTVASMPAVRVEVREADPDVVRLTYWISAGATVETGPTIVATTSTDLAGIYELNKAVLDLMMERLATGE